MECGADGAGACGNNMTVRGDRWRLHDKGGLSPGSPRKSFLCDCCFSLPTAT